MGVKVNTEPERLIAATAIALSSIIGAIVGLAYGLATGGISTISREKASSAHQAPPSRSGELELFLVSTISAVAGALADIEDLADLFAYFTAFLSSMSAAFYQNPLNLFPLLLALLLRLAKTAG